MTLISDFSSQNPVEYALAIIEQYEFEIRNSVDDNILGIDLKAKGFCQGRLFTEAKAKIERLYNDCTISCPTGTVIRGSIDPVTGVFTPEQTAEEPE